MIAKPPYHRAMFDPPTVRCPFPRSPDHGDGIFRNPVICADYSDPDVIRDGDDFWLTASSFNCTPGLPILHSRDLVNWTIVNHALKNLPDDRYREVQHGCGVWAPAIRKHVGKFWIFFPTPDEGIYVTTADDPRKEWSAPRMLMAGKGLIDPCPLWDDDGKAYLVFAYARSRAGIKDRLHVRPMSPDATEMIGEGKIVFHEPERHPTLEGPKFHKRNGWYYLSAPAGGVKTGWQLILRSRNVYGPYEEKIVLHQGNTPINGPHQGALVDTPSGEWWFVHFQDAYVYGRIAHLQPVRWEDDWPLIGIDINNDGIGEPVVEHRKPSIGGAVATCAPRTSDEFDGDKLGLQWQWHANHADDWASLTARQGFLRLRAVGSEDDFAKTRNLLLQKLPATHFIAETIVELNATRGEHAGLIVMGEQHAAMIVQQSEAGAQLVLAIDNKVIESRALPAAAAKLRVEMGDGGASRFSFAVPGGGFQVLDAAFTAVAGRWIGAKVGIFCRAIGADAKGFADFEYFRFLPPSS